ncbi:MAG: hypothetical protein K6T85_10825 [Gorillibacterium sp.]|nr:hypothetical protein [Gorillibacterium sp.]
MLEVFDKDMLSTGVLPSAERKRRISSDYELSFQLPMISDDYREKIVQKGHVRDERGQFYVINRIKKNIISTNFKDNITGLLTRLFPQMKDGWENI